MLVKEGLDKVVTSIKRLCILVIRAIFFSPLFGVIVGVPAFLVGSRLYEIGGVGDLKGATVKLSGICFQNGVERKPALAEDQVKITGISDGQISGVIRATRESVKCDLASVAIDKLPLTYEQKGVPVAIPAITPAIDNSKELELQKYISRTLTVSGLCTLDVGGQMTLVDKLVDVTQLKKVGGINDFAFVGVLKDEGKVVECLTDKVKFNISNIVINDQRDSYQKPNEKKQDDYVGKSVLVTGTCYPDSHLPKDVRDKDKVAYWPMLNAEVQVLANKIVDGEVVWLSGALVSKAAMIECDLKKSIFKIKEYDPRVMTLKPSVPEKEIKETLNNKKDK